MKNDDIKTVKVMVIYPDGDISDEELLEVPEVGDSIRIRGKSYRVTEVHESMIQPSDDKWGCNWVITLSN